ncbi:ADP-ribose pyrophosphatase YjhB, NUDIX family [Streptomyces sp. LamerLS-316]|uniref:NUDIX domain-containing protein n=1 Tax=unclassified Streptomyces TaxID=2593676 RepID=UPI000823D01A|nr:NUDIX hydrolase [Streptomyces sp. LamerLS-316]MYQ41207.1 NUDIX domain-containing protein [Streptomyces sp. SID4921]SCK08614.1 ADP-ribose pyrophosphatase YjhB, NUDIX family [Streptomyces sp. LamerLS-316]
MIVWINGAFSAGKTSAACELIDLIPNSTFYDPGLTGGGLRRLLPQKKLAEVTDFQDLPIWRRLVVDTAAALLAELSGVLVVPMTLLRQEYRDEIFGGLASRRIPVRHVLLSPEETILRKRIAEREEFADDPEHSERVRQWAYEHIEPYRAALGWITADAHTIDTSALTPYETAERIAEALRTGEARECGIVQTPEPRAETVASGVLLFDEQDRVLLVDPTYKPGWEFPGGVVEPGEAPAQAGIREVAEELGLRLDTVPELLVVDWEAPRPPAYGGLRFLFDGGRLHGEDAARLLLPGSELRGWRFVTEEEAAGLLPPTRFERLRWALRARERSSVLNLEAGVPVGGP